LKVGKLKVKGGFVGGEVVFSFNMNNTNIANYTNKSKNMVTTLFVAPDLKSS